MYSLVDRSVVYDLDEKPEDMGFFVTGLIFLLKCRECLTGNILYLSGNK